MQKTPAKNNVRHLKDELKFVKRSNSFHHICYTISIRVFRHIWHWLITLSRHHPHMPSSTPGRLLTEMLASPRQFQLYPISTRHEALRTGTGPANTLAPRVSRQHRPNGTWITSLIQVHFFSTGIGHATCCKIWRCHHFASRKKRMDSTW